MSGIIKQKMEIKMPTISVIIPVYNVERYLPQCIESIINQTFKDIEIICVNDGSTDACGRILAEYAEKDGRIKVLTQENLGLSAARNNGIAQAKGEYISFIDSDDFVHPQFLETLYGAIKQYDSDIVGCDFQKIYSSEVWALHNSKVEIFTSALDVLLDSRNFIHFNVWNKLYKRSVIGDIRFVAGIFYEDWVFNCCVFERANGFCWLKDKLYAYRNSENSIMRSSFNAKKLADYERGIRAVYDYYVTNAEAKWEKVKKTRISRTVKMMMNSAKRSKNAELKNETALILRRLYDEKLITYCGLSFKNKIKLYCFLH